MSNPSQIALENALLLAEQGIPSFPCLVNKKPACPGGYKAATLDATALQNLWKRYPGELVGVPTGVKSGRDVLDIDPKNGGDIWLKAHAHLLPETRVHQTRSGGVHIFLNSHAGLKISAGRIAQGIDVRATGGYVIWWPATGLPVVNDVPIADWPEWLLALAMPAPAKHFERFNYSPPVTGAGYAHAALRRAARALSSAPEGCRNETLNREAWSLLRFASDGQLRVQDIANTLAAAGLAAGLTRPEIIATLMSALRARGMA